MNETNKKVRIIWNKKENGGKKNIPLGNYYVIAEEVREGEIYAWSIVLDVKNNFIENGEWVGYGFARFLVKEAPYYLLEKGCLTKIFEGKIYVGELTVV